MIGLGSTVGRRVAICITIVGLALTGAIPSRSADQFPFDRELLLEAPPMRPGKRMPSLTVEPSGMAVFDLWCRSVAARVELGEGTIKIEAAQLTEDLPAMQSNGQCTPERLRADQNLLAVLVQATSWRAAGHSVVLDGAVPLKFRPATN